MRRTLFAFCLLPSLLLSAQAYMVKDITTLPIPVSSYPRYVGTAGGITYIQAFRTLCRTDGTVAGTVRLGNIPLASSRQGQVAVAAGNRLVFLAYSGYSVQLFATDGVETRQLSGTTWQVESLFGDGTLAFFTSIDGLWVTDGTTQGTHRVSERVWDGGGYRAYGVAVGPLVFFAQGPELHVTDGANTIELSTELRYDGFLATAVKGNLLYFVGRDDLWVTDGTVKGTRSVLHFGCCMGEDPPIVAGDSVYYVTRKSSSIYELWKVGDAGAQRVAQLRSPIRLMSWNDQLYYATEHEIFGPHGSESLSSVTFLRFIAPIGDRLFFAASDRVNGEELWSVNGEGRDADLVNLAPDGKTWGSSLLWMQTAGDDVLFVVRTDYDHLALWRSDGTDWGTYPLLTLPALPPAIQSVVIDDISYISLGDTGLWRTDGTIAGTVRLANRSNAVAKFRNGVIFEGFDDAAGFEPWISDGTLAGTHRIADTREGPESGGMQSGIEIGDQFYFAAYDFKHRALGWRTDGMTATPIATPRVFRPSFTEFQGSVYFTAFAGNGGELMKVRDGTWSELIGRVVPDTQMFVVGSQLLILTTGAVYRSDGVSVEPYAGGFSVPCGAFVGARASRPQSSDVSSGDETSDRAGRPLAAGGTPALLYWMSPDDLWRTDGTTAGTFRIASFAHDVCSVMRDDRWAYFIAKPGRVWRMDLESGETSPLIDLKGYVSTDAGVALAGSKLFYAGDDGVHGQELWALPIDAHPRRATR
ncbi:MAG TPA: hypothetical protein VII75_09420 [Thermoanaerobaculia bacterium]